MEKNTEKGKGKNMFINACVSFQNCFTKAKQNYKQLTYVKYSTKAVNHPLTKQGES